jgi:hypothetical protein
VLKRSSLLITTISALPVGPHAAELLRLQLAVEHLGVGDDDGAVQSVARRVAVAANRRIDAS